MPGAPRLFGYLPWTCLLQPKGGSFTGEEKDFLRFVLGQHQVIPAFEEAVASMKVRQPTFQSVKNAAAHEAIWHRVCQAKGQLPK